MEVVFRFTLQPTKDAAGERASSLWCDGRPTGRSVPGVTLEAQYAIGERTLLFVTHDIPFEEQLEILLLDATGGILDRASLFGLYATGTFVAGKVVDAVSVTFRFFGGEERMVRVLPARAVRMPFSEPPGVHRRAALRCWFRVS